jgi:hypothetical protein
MLTSVDFQMDLVDKDLFIFLAGKRIMIFMGIDFRWCWWWRMLFGSGVD